MSPRVLVPTLALFATASFLIAFLPGADAASANPAAREGCAWLDHRGPTGDNHYKISTEAAPIASEDCADQAAYRVPQAGCLTFRTAFSAGATPAPPTVVRLYVYADDQSSTHAGAWPTPIHHQQWASAEAFHGQTVGLCATTTALAGGTGAAGTFRLVLRACNVVNPGADPCAGTQVVYDVNSDDGGPTPGVGNSVAGTKKGGYVGGLTPTAFVDARSAGGTDEDTYVGGDTPHLRLAATKALANTGVESVTLAIVAENGGASVSSVASTDLRSGATAEEPLTSITYSGNYLNSTRPTARATITGNSALFARPWTYFASAPAGATLTSDTQLDKPWGLVDLWLRVTCPRLENPLLQTGEVTLLMGGESVRCRDAPTVHNARGPLASGTFVSVFMVREGRPVGDTTDAPPCTLTLASAGAWTCDDLRVGSTATVTHGTQPLDYAVEIVQYSTAARTTAWNAGRTAPKFDVSRTLTTGVQTYRTACAGDQVDTYVLAADLIAMQEGVTRNARGETWTVSTTYTRTYVNGLRINDLPSDSAVSATGQTLCHTIAPEPPALDGWFFNVTVADGGGNTGTASKRIGIISPYTASYALNILGTGTPIYPGSGASLVIQTLERDSAGVFQPAASDAPCFWWIDATDADGRVTRIVPVTPCAAQANAPHAYWANFTIPDDWPDGRAATLTASANMSGAAVTRVEPLLIHSPILGDPLTVHAADVLLGEPVDITIHAAWDNGTARTGAADNITIHVAGPDGAFVLADVHPVELLAPNGRPYGYYGVSFKPGATGTYRVFVNATTAQAEERSAPPMTFRVLSAVSGGPGTASLDPEAFAYTNALINATTDRILTEVRDVGSRLTYYGDGIFGLANGSLQARDFYAWRDGEARAIWAIVNGTATQVDLRYLGSGIWAAVNETGAPVPDDAFRQWRDTEWRQAWVSLNATATQATLTSYGSGIYALAQGALTADEFRQWRAGEARPMWAVLNGTARQATLTYYGSGLWTATNLTLPADEFRGWRAGEWRDATLLLDGAMRAETFERWDEERFRPAAARVEATATQASLAHYGNGLFAVANRTLSGAEFRNWRDGEARPMWATINDTAREGTLVYFGEGIWAAVNVSHSGEWPLGEWRDAHIALEPVEEIPPEPIDRADFTGFTVATPSGPSLLDRIAIRNAALFPVLVVSGTIATATALTPRHTRLDARRALALGGALLLFGGYLLANGSFG